MIVVVRRIDGVVLDYQPGVPCPIRPGVFMDADFDQAEAYADSLAASQGMRAKPWRTEALEKFLNPEWEDPHAPKLEGHVFTLTHEDERVISFEGDLTITVVMVCQKRGRTRHHTFKLSEIVTASLKPAAGKDE